MSAPSQAAGGSAEFDLSVGSRPWLHAVAQTVRYATLDTFAVVNTCIATTAYGCHVLARYGIVARPQSVWVHAINAKAYRLREQGVPPSRWPDDAWSVGINPHMGATDKPHDGTGWTGHLVVVVRQPGQPRLLIDLTADQFDRPRRHLRVGGPVFMDIPPGSSWTPQDSLSTIIGGADHPDGDPHERNATLVEYVPAAPTHPEASAWKTSPDWVRHGDPDDPAVRANVDTICAALERLLDEQDRRVTP